MPREAKLLARLFETEQRDFIYLMFMAQARISRCIQIIIEKPWWWNRILNLNYYFSFPSVVLECVLSINASISFLPSLPPTIFFPLSFLLPLLLYIFMSKFLLDWLSLNTLIYWNILKSSCKLDVSVSLKWLVWPIHFMSMLKIIFVYFSKF